MCSDTPKPISSYPANDSAAATRTEGRDSSSIFLPAVGYDGHAVLDQNDEDGGNRQIHSCSTSRTDATARDHPTIAEITKERVRRVIKKLNDEDTSKLDLERRTETGPWLSGFQAGRIELQTLECRCSA